MAEKTDLSIPTQTPISDNAADDPISEADYLENYAANFYEWVNGKVEKMSPVSREHDELTRYLLRLFEAYLSIRKIGSVAIAPFAMHLPDSTVYREPDLQFIRHASPTTITDDYVDGPADICVEIVTKSSIQRDHSTKLVEYEQGGVGEYWIIDPDRREARFLRLTDSGTFLAQHTHPDDAYRTPTLPDFALHVPTLWQEHLPDYGAVWNAVQSMLNPA
jgi:Uma2 family endonuclease